MGEHLSNRLAVLEADVISTVRLAPVEAVRARGDRLRWWGTPRAFAAVVAMFVAIGLGAGGVGLMAAGGRDDSWTTFPAGFAMPNEGAPGWQRDDSLDAAGAFNPCGAPDISRADRIAARTMTGSAFPDDPNPVRLTEQLLLYRDEPAAAQVMDQLRGLTNQAPCGWIGGVYQGTFDLGPEVLWSGHQADNGHWQDVLITRYGAAIYIIHATGTSGTAPYNEDLGSVQLIRDRLCAQMRICVASGPTAQPSVNGSDPAPAPSWWDFLQTPYPAATPPNDPWQHLNPVPTPTP